MTPETESSPSPAPSISVVIPSHNRQDLLAQVLDRLANQRSDTPDFEVVVVLDGCRDGSPAMLAARQDPFALRWIELPGVGPSMARNAGVRETLGALLLFIDDDVIPTDGLVAEHLAAHAGTPGAVVLGPYPPEPVAYGDRFRLNVRRWWTAHFDALSKPGVRFTYRDLLTGNLSMTRRLWDEVGGLDPQFARAREDWELGVRLMAHGVPFVYAPEALGWHQEHLTSSQASALRRAKEEGRSDALMAIKHPALAPRFSTPRQLRKPGPGTWLRRKLLPHMGLADGVVMGLGPKLLDMVEWAGLCGARLWLNGQLTRYCYQRGAVEVLGRGIADFGAGDDGLVLPSVLEIDLAEGLEEAEAILARMRPGAVRFHFAGQEIATLPYSPAAEPWNARHLRALLMRPSLARKLAPILAARRFGGSDVDWKRVEALGMIGVSDFIAQLHEGHRQWRRSFGN